MIELSRDTIIWSPLFLLRACGKALHSSHQHHSYSRELCDPHLPLN